MKKTIFATALAAAAILTSCTQSVSPEQTWKELEKPLNFYLINDSGRNGYYEQKTIAETMGKMAETIDIEFVVAAGDVHHFEGVRSVSDPLWMTNYELIYSHPDLMIPWYPVCGNHEYRGNTQAPVDYSKVSARWDMPAKYYTFTAEEDSASVRIVMLDTTPLIDKYREDTEKYPDASKSEVETQLEWLDSVLTAATEDWVLVVGHHPIYAETPKDDVERTDLQRTLLPILKKYNNVSLYACGHIHNFQHIKMKGDSIDYVVNSAGSLARSVKPVEGTVFCSSEPGFSVISATKKSLNMYMIDKTGKVLHTVTKTK